VGLWLAAGAAVGELAWLQGHAPLLLCAVPALWVLAATPAHAFALMVGFMGASTESLLAGAFTFSQSMGQTVLLVAGWAALAVAVAAIWTLAHLGFKRGRLAGAAAGVAAQVLLLVPPMWLLGLASPLIGWGFMLGGTGWIGVVIGLVLPVAVGTVLRGRPRRTAAGAMTALLLPLLLLSGRDEPGLRNARGVHAVVTRWGDAGQSGWQRVVDRLPKIGAGAKAAARVDPSVRTVVFPEASLGSYVQPESPAFRMELVEVAREANLQIAVGVDTRVGAGWREGLAIIDPDGRVTRLYARQPTPLSLWRPWDASSYEADWYRRNFFKLPDGRTAYVSFCHEDVLPGFFLQAMLEQKRPDLVISVANVWWMLSDEGARRQARHIEGMARMFGVPLVRAVNLPQSR
jgi:apolipoprotein N-acyltransferase